MELSARQRSLYKALLANVSVADLLEKAANIGDADSARSLMNLVMQFRKVRIFFFIQCRVFGLMLVCRSATTQSCSNVPMLLHLTHSPTSVGPVP